MRLWRRDDSGYWYASIRDASGRRVKRSTGYTDRKAAEAIAREWERELADPDAAALRAETVATCLERFVLATRNERTRSFYAQKAGHLVAILGADTRLSDLRPAHLDAYLATRRGHYVVEPSETREGKPVSEHTIHKELATLRAALTQSARLGLYKGDARALVPRHSPEYRPREHWLTLSQVHTLIESFHTSVADHAARVAFAVAVGAEWSALDRARREDIGEDFVRVRGTKSETRDRVVPIVLDWQRALLAFVREHATGEGGLLFAPWYWRSALLSLERAAARCGLPHTTWHDLRRTYAQLMRRAGAELEDLAPTLGHANARVTAAVYARLDVEALRVRLAASTGTPVGQTDRKEAHPSDPSDESRGEKERKSPGKSGGSSGTRTRSQRIKSPLHELTLRQESRGERPQPSSAGTPVGQLRRVK